MAPAASAEPTPDGPTPGPVATSEELRRAALKRSAARGAEVARKRLARRHALRVARLLVTWLGPLLVLGSLGWNSARPPVPGTNDSTLPRPSAQAQSPSAAATRANRGDP